MKIVHAGVAAMALAVLPVSATAGFLDGNDLYKNCQAPAASPMGGACVGYIIGISDAMKDAMEIGGNPIAEWVMCLPGGVSSEQTTDIVKAFLTAHPEIRHYTAASLVARALADAFPCPKK